PEKQSKEQMISQLVLEQFIKIGHCKDRSVLKEQWELSGRNIGRFMESLTDECLKPPVMQYVGNCCSHLICDTVVFIDCWKEVMKLNSFTVWQRDYEETLEERFYTYLKSWIQNYYFLEGTCRLTLEGGGRKLHLPGVESELSNIGAVEPWDCLQPAQGWDGDLWRRKNDLKWWEREGTLNKNIQGSFHVYKSKVEK
ncbi:zinc finger protein and SCAN domain containing protein 4C-like, partial [Sigmodon hispidus]